MSWHKDQECSGMADGDAQGNRFIKSEIELGIWTKSAGVDNLFMKTSK